MIQFFRAVSFTFLFLITITYAKAQTWTWINGSSTTPTTLINPDASYGTLGVSSPTNYPGARSGFQSWKDANGIFWEFGGYAKIGTYGFCNDLWKYDPLANSWTWMKGANLLNQLSTFGTQGVPTSSTTPGGRDQACSWVDNAGNFWLFGGSGYAANGYGYLNELWKYNPLNNEWTWMNGTGSSNQAGVYGLLNTPSASNAPGGRKGATAWKDNSGDLWFFGGEGYGASATSGSLNDVWKYSISTNQWTWMGGTSSTNQTPVSGTQGVGSTTNIPGGRAYSTNWKDASGEIFIFGGLGVATNSFGILGDLWKYSTSNGQWTWLRGSLLKDQAAVYGTMGVSSSTIDPGGRFTPLTWKDASGNFWLWGGGGSPSFYGDMWKYTVSTNQWTWVNGTNVGNPMTVNGTLGVASPTNSPGSRKYSGTWTDGLGNLWLFGGQGYVTGWGSAHFNDIWKYEICSAADTPTNVSTAGNLVKCSGGSSTLSVSSSAPVTWYASPTSTTALGTGTNYSTGPLTTGTLTYYAEANLCSPSAARAVITVTVNPIPTIGVNSGSICSGNSFTIIPTGANMYTITGGNSIVTPSATTLYTVSGQSSAGCTATSNAVCFVTVNPTPTLSVTGQFTLCNGASANLSVTGANTYTWNNTTISPSIQVTPSVTTTYSATGETLFGCTSSVMQSITVYTIPFVSAAGGSICAGSVFTILPTGANSYSYSSGSATVSPSSNTTYTVTGISTQGCPSSNNASLNVTVAPLPSFSISGNNYVCLGSSVSQIINGSAISYTWSNGSNSNLITVSPTVNTTYSVALTGTNGCISSASKLISVNPLPTVSAIASNQTICLNDGVILNGYGASTYSWSGNVIDNTLFYPSSSTTYTVTGFDANACSNTATVSISVNPLPIINASSSSSLICALETASLNASGAIAYVWNTAQAGAIIIINPSVTTSYTVTGIDVNGCENALVLTQLVSDCVGIDKINNDSKQVKAYPNPGNGLYTLELNAFSETITIEIYNSLGELTSELKPTDVITPLNIENKASGVYILILKEQGLPISMLKLIKD